MPHLLKFRKGWQSEHIAKFILSQFSFIAEPSTIADDIGSDFICTLFKVEKSKYLFPQSSFTIQIKSSKKKFDISKNHSYFLNLKIPYFVGVVNKQKLKMRVYSGESIPHCFSCYGGKIIYENYKAYIRPLDKPSNRHHNFISINDEKKECYLDFPFIGEFRAIGENNISSLSEICQLIQHNISTQSTDSHFFYLYGWDTVNIYTGPGSRKTFRNNFYNRLIEVILNLEWIYNTDRNDFDHEEYKIYKSMIQDLIKKHGKLNNMLESQFLRIDNIISKNSSN